MLQLGRWENWLFESPLASFVEACKRCAMDVVTDSAWPKISDWAERLSGELTTQYDAYDKETDLLKKRSMTIPMLRQIVNALWELPPFQTSRFDLPLEDIIIFFYDLAQGRDHPWAKTLSVGGTNITSSSRAVLKVWVRICFDALQDRGFGRVEAYRHLSSGLTKSALRMSMAKLLFVL